MHDFTSWFVSLQNMVVVYYGSKWRVGNVMPELGSYIWVIRVQFVGDLLAFICLKRQ